nr:efflux transporter outer membrane subunit [Hydrogenophaga sp. BPS33]
MNHRPWMPLVLLSAAVLAGCALTPPAPPDVQGVVPPALGQSQPPANATQQALDEAQALAWVQHPGLRQTIAQALTHNRDLRTALFNIERARAQYGIASAAQLPTVAANAQGSRTRTPGDLSSSGNPTTSTQITAQLAITSFELDLWGRVRNLNEAALQQFLQSEANQQNVRITLVADVANAWLNLAANQSRLKLAQDTLAGREKAYQLTERIFQLGATSGLVLAQNRSTVETARGDVAAFTAQVAKDRNALILLVGNGLNADWLPTADTLQGTQAPAALLERPATIDSSVLLQRPDVRASELNLRAVSANVAAARAALFPTISLTTSVGTGSRELDGLFGSGNGSWSFVPQIRLPIFDGGSGRAAVNVAQANRDIAISQYEKAIQTAFREASDALAERAQWQARLSAQEAVVAANAQAFQLSEARFTSGVDNYLTVLDAQRSLYAAQQNLIALRLSEQANRIALWKVLGG